MRVVFKKKRGNLAAVLVPTTLKPRNAPKSWFTRNMLQTHASYIATPSMRQLAVSHHMGQSATHFAQASAVVSQWLGFEVCEFERHWKNVSKRFYVTPFTAEGDCKFNNYCWNAQGKQEKTCRELKWTTGGRFCSTTSNYLCMTNSIYEL